MPLQLRRGSDADRIATTFAEGEPVWTTDTTKLYVGDGVTPGAIAVGGNQTLNTNSNVTFNSLTVATTATVATIKFGDNTTMVSATTSTLWNGSDKAYLDGSAFVATKFQAAQTGGSLSGNGYSFQNEAFSDTGMFSQTDGDLQFFTDNVRQIQLSAATGTSILNTLTVQSLTVALNTGTTARDFGYGAMPYNANNMKIEVPYNGASLFFAFKNPGGAARNVGFSRQGTVVLQQGAIGNAFPSGVFVNSNDGGPAFVGVSTTTNGVVYSSRVGANTSTGVFQIVQNNAGVNFSTLLDYNGTFTVPRDLVVTTTATVATLKFGDGTTMTTAATGGGGGVAGDQSVYTTSSVTFNTLDVTTTATVATLKFGDGTTMTTAPDQSLNTTSNVTFANAVVTTRIDTSEIYANATTQDLTLTANFNGAGSGAGGSVNIFSANGSAALPKVEILGDAINFKNADGTVNYGGFGFDTGLSVTTTATVGALRFGTETAITSRSELIGPTGPAGDPGATGPTGPAGATGGYSGTESVYALGNTSGTLSVDATSATIFTMTLNGNLTMNAITNVVTGTNATFVITQDGTGGRTLTSSWKFAGGAKTLTTAGTATDMISVFYDGATYYASLSRGFV